MGADNLTWPLKFPISLRSRMTCRIEGLFFGSFFIQLSAISMHLNTCWTCSGVGLADLFHLYPHLHRRSTYIFMSITESNSRMHKLLKTKILVISECKSYILKDWFDRTHHYTPIVTNLVSIKLHLERFVT